MTAAASDPRPPQPVKPGRSRRWFILVVVLASVVAVGGWYMWRSKTKIEPPAVDLDGADSEVAAAIEAARAEVRKSPRAAAAWGKLGKVLAAHEYYQAAGFCFAEAERLEPEQARWPYFHGLTLTFTQPDAAIAQYRRSLQLHGDEPAIRLRLAETLESQGRLDEAEEHYRWLAENDALAPRAWLGLSRLAFQHGDLPSARKNLGPCDSNPLTQSAAHSLLAAIEQRANDPIAAAREHALVAALPEDQDWGDPFVDEIDQLKVGKAARLDYALRLVRQQRSSEATAQFRQLVSDYPNWDQGWLTFGRFLLESESYAEAEEVLRKALTIAPESVGGQFRLGVVLFQRGEYREAVTHFRETTRLKPDHALAYFNLGHALKRLNDRPGAVEAFRAAVRCNSSMASPHTNLGELLAEQGDKPAAVEELRTALQLNPKDATAKKLLQQLAPDK